MLRWLKKKLHRHDFREYALVDLPVSSWLTGHEKRALPFVVYIDSPGGLRPLDAWFIGFVCRKCHEPGYGTEDEVLSRLEDLL